MIALLLVAPGCLPASSGDGEPACQEDADCAEQEVCLRPPADHSQCVADCTGDSSICSSDEFCRWRYDPNTQEEDRGELVCFPATIRCEEQTDCPISVLCAESGFCEAESQGDECESVFQCNFSEDCRSGLCVDEG